MWASREEERESAPIMLQLGVDCDPSNQDHRDRVQQEARLQGFELAAFLDTPTTLAEACQSLEFHLKRFRSRGSTDRRPAIVVVRKEVDPTGLFGYPPGTCDSHESEWWRSRLTCTAFGIDSDQEYWILQPANNFVSVGKVMMHSTADVVTGWSRGPGRIGAVSPSWTAREAAVEYGYEASTFGNVSSTLEAIPAVVLEYLGLQLISKIHEQAIRGGNPVGPGNSWSLSTVDIPSMSLAWAETRAESSTGYVPPFDRNLRVVLRKECRSDSEKHDKSGSYTPALIVHSDPDPVLSKFVRPDLVLTPADAHGLDAARSLAATEAANNDQRNREYIAARQRLFGTDTERIPSLPAKEDLRPRSSQGVPRSRMCTISCIQVLIQYRSRLLAVPVGEGLVPFLLATVPGALKFKDRTGPQWELMLSLLQLEVARWFGGRQAEKGIRGLVLSAVRRGRHVSHTNSQPPVLSNGSDLAKSGATLRCFSFAFCVTIPEGWDLSSLAPVDHAPTIGRPLDNHLHHLLVAGQEGD